MIHMNGTSFRISAFFWGILLASAFCISAAAQGEAKAGKLFNALRNTDMKAVKAALSAGVDVNVGDDDGLTPLMYAAIYAGPDCIGLLLRKGADPNARSKGGVTALMLAADDTEKVRLLLSKGAEVNAVSKQGHTALDIAASREGSLEAIKLLLDHGADLSLGNSLGPAARIGDLRVMKLLLEKGADPNGIKSLGGPPPSSAKRTAERNKALETSPVSPIQFFRVGAGGTPLMFAALARNTDVVKLLLEKGANPNARTKDLGSCALIFAAAAGDPATVRLLVEKGAEVNVRHESGYTALMYAAASENTDPEMIKVLLAHGAEVNAKAKDGETALTLAGRKGNTEIVRLLEKAGGKE